jgi:dihydrofolate reductase
VNKISLIVAIAKNGAIGNNNQLLWHIKDDLRLFKQTTHGHVVIHGRKSFESIGKPLPNRTNIVITRNTNYNAKGAFLTHSLDDAIKLAQKLEQKREIFVLGGAEIYRQSLEVVDKLYLSHVDCTFENADTFFPEFDLNQWQQISKQAFPKNETNEFSFEFCEYVRKA